MTMHVAVFGTGGVGGYFGARLAAAGNDVVFIARGAHLAAILADGLAVRSPLGDVTISPTQATDTAGEIGPVDLVICAVKAWQVEDAAAAMVPLIGPATAVLPLQNGVEAPDQLASVLGVGPVLGGACWIVARIEAPGAIVHAGVEPRITLGELDGSDSTRVEGIRETLVRAGVRAEASGEIRAVLWRKLLFIAPTSGLGAVTGLPPAAFRAVPETRRMLTAGLEEVAAVARAHGAAVGVDDVAATLAFIDALPGDATSSLQRDVAAGRPSELDAQVGAVVRLGASGAVPTPTHAFLYAVLLPRELRARAAHAAPRLQAD